MFTLANTKPCLFGTYLLQVIVKVSVLFKLAHSPTTTKTAKIFKFFKLIDTASELDNFLLFSLSPKNQSLVPWLLY